MSDAVTFTTSDGFEVESRTESLEQLQENFAADEAPATDEKADAEPVDQKTDAKIVEPPKADKRTREGRKQSIQQEIDDLTAQKHTTKREAEAAAAEVAAMRSQLAELQQQRHALQPQAQTPRPQPVAQNDPEPQLPDFKDQPDPWAAHMRALGRWEARQEFQRQQQSARQQQQQQQVIGQIQQVEQGYIGKLTTRLEKEPKFWERVPEFADLRPTHYLKQDEPIRPINRLADEILISETPMELIDYLHDHPKDHQRLLTLQPRDLVREIGKITARLEAAHSGPASKSPVLSAAKPPMKPVGGSLVVSDDDVGEDDDLSEAAVNRFIKTANAKERSANARR